MGTSKEKYLRQYEIDGNCTECLGNNLLRRYGIDMALIGDFSSLFMVLIVRQTSCWYLTVVPHERTKMVSAIKISKLCI